MDDELTRLREFRRLALLALTSYGIVTMADWQDADGSHPLLRIVNQERVMDLLRFDEGEQYGRDGRLQKVRQDSTVS